MQITTPLSVIYPNLKWISVMLKSKRPHKQLLWFWMNDKFTLSKNYEIGLDIACGSMSFKPLFNTKQYVGIDIDKKRIELGLKHHPDALSCVKPIESLDDTDKGDFVICLQTIGINKHFIADNTIKCIKNLVHSTNLYGSLIFNVGPKSKLYFDDIESYLFSSFKHVEVKHYGRFNKKFFKLLSYFFATIMYHFNFFAYSQSNPYRFYVCLNKRN